MIDCLATNAELVAEGVERAILGLITAAMTAIQAVRQGSHEERVDYLADFPEVHLHIESAKMEVLFGTSLFLARLTPEVMIINPLGTRCPVRADP